MWPFGREATREVVRREPAKTPRREPRLSEEFLARAKAGTVKRHPFTVAQPAPGVVPAGTPVMAQDDAVSLYGYAPTALCGLEEGLFFLGYPYLAELAQRAEYRRISELLARELTRKWIKFHATGDEDKSDKIKRIEAEWDRLRVQALFGQGVETDGLFGRAHLFMDMGNNEPLELATPLITAREKITEGSLKSLRLIEPMWTYPSGYNAADPLAPDFYNPSSWYVQGRKVHASRLLTLVGREVPDLLKPAYQFGGLSLSQLSKPYVDNWLRTRQSVSDLIKSFSTTVLATDMGAALTGAPGQNVFDRVDVFNAMRDNRGTMVIDKTNEDFKNVSAQLGTLDKLQAQSQEHMASVHGYPLVKLFGITPTGLNASSEGEFRAFYDWCHGQQEHMLTRPLKRLLDVTQLSLFGEIDPGITFTYEPLWQMDDAALATIRKTNAETFAVYATEGVVSNEEERLRLAQDEGSLYAGIDLSGPAPEPHEARTPFGTEEDPLSGHVDV